MSGETDGFHQTPSHSPKATNGASPSSRKFPMTSSSPNGTSHSNGDHSYTNGQSQVSNMRILSPTFFGHDREQATRILIQGLNDMGYQSAASVLSRESGYDLETPHAAAFRNSILSGDWDTAQALVSGNLPDKDDDTNTTLLYTSNGQDQNDTSIDGTPVRRRRTRGLSLIPEADRGEMLFLIRQQKYLELLEMRDLGSALMVLRQELQPLQQEESRLHSLSTLMMCKTSDDLKYKAGWDGTLGESRKVLLSHLSRYISPSTMIPEHRLADLFTQVKENQIAHCLYHNRAMQPSLYEDHVCEQSELPIDMLHEINDHESEVWYLCFSNDGTKLATASKDKTVNIYETTNFKQLHALNDHQGSIVYLSWSPDDKELISCSSDKTARLWEIESGKCISTIHHHEEPVTSAAWAPDGKTFVTGSLDSIRPLAMWLTDSALSSSGRLLHEFRNQCDRVQDCAISAPASAANTSVPVRLAAMCCTVNIIYVYDYLRKEEISRISLEHPMTCLNFSADGEDMLINLSCHEIWLLEVETGDVRQKFRGQKQSRFVIKSCFGGASEGFIVSGSEDGNLCIWHRHSSRLLEQLPSHGDKCVNAVAWNPAQPYMYASAGDDDKVRIWGRAVESQQSSAQRSAAQQPLGFIEQETQSQSQSQTQTSNISSADNGHEATRSTLPSWGQFTTSYPHIAEVSLATLMRHRGMDSNGR